MAETLESRVALVTGASSGIGRASAIAFAREGAKVVAADVDVVGGEETVSMIKEAGGDAIFFQSDVSRTADVEAMVNNAIESYGRLDCAHNNAGIEGSIGIHTHEYREDVWDRIISINLKGVWLCMKYEILQMLKQGGGAIVNTASIAGLVGSPLAGPGYGASKHGVVGLTKTAALEYAQQGIRVNAVCPGIICTPMVERLISAIPDGETRIVEREPVGRLGTPEEIAEAVVWLCSAAASFITGHAMAVDGGYVAQ